MRKAKTSPKNLLEHIRLFLIYQLSSLKMEQNIIEDLDTSEYVYADQNTKNYTIDAMLACWIRILEILNNRDGYSLFKDKITIYRTIISLEKREEFLLTSSSWSKILFNDLEDKTKHIYRQVLSNTINYIVTKGDYSNPAYKQFISQTLVNGLFVFPTLQTSLLNNLSWNIDVLKNNTIKKACEFIYKEKPLDNEIREFVSTYVDFRDWSRFAGHNDEVLLRNITDIQWDAILINSPYIFCEFLRCFVNYVCRVHMLHIRTGETNEKYLILWNYVPLYSQIIEYFMCMFNDACFSSSILNYKYKTHNVVPYENCNTQKLNDINDSILLGDGECEEEPPINQTPTKSFNDVKDWNPMKCMSYELAEEIFETAQVLLENPQLLASLMYIITEACTINNVQSVNQTFRYLSKFIWVSERINKVKSFSSDKVYINNKAEFMLFIKNILRSKNSSIILSCMVFLYNQLNSFETSLKNSLIMIMLDEHFRDFFLHWRLEIRCCFHYILVYKAKTLENAVERHIQYLLQRSHNNQTLTQDDDLDVYIQTSVSEYRKISGKNAKSKAIEDPDLSSILIK